MGRDKRGQVAVGQDEGGVGVGKQAGVFGFGQVWVQQDRNDAGPQRPERDSEVCG